MNYYILGGLIITAFSCLIILSGFGTVGITAGSIAAGVQSTIGNVAAGSMFATTQSLAMQGVFASSAVIGGIVAGSEVINEVVTSKNQNNNTTTENSNVNRSSDKDTSTLNNSDFLKESINKNDHE